MLIWVVFNPDLGSQTPHEFPLYSIPHTEVRTIESKHVDNMVYKIDIALPDNYHHTERTYPTLYVLDSWFYFGIVAQTYRALRIFEEVPEMIIVGISHFGEDLMDDVRYRSRDYTPTSVDSTFWLPVTGGAPQFQQFIAHELFPFIDKNYRTNREDRAITGFSAGGIFSTYVLFNHPGMFNRFIIGGPAAWYDDYVVLDYEKAYSLKNQSLPAKIFMTVGGNEVEAQIKGWSLLRDSIESRNYLDLEMTAVQIENEGHVSQALISFIKGMQMVFK
jgi:predicted alpha/beta superfamily hydrolase